ncbi:uncharacterized protein LOC124926165 [Impatiens glandulifera]|uniref:uncharacterized protein LOC124926165 n=1 Tax=Impatiens glandulifera TaxID=253017 RepID=UPI001FB10141|nr:uncharacterized protein LOC124926165 [Impatiens glandulifera]
MHYLLSSFSVTKTMLSPIVSTIPLILGKSPPLLHNICQIKQSDFRYPTDSTRRSRPSVLSPLYSASPAILPDIRSNLVTEPSKALQGLEENIEKTIFGCRFFALFAVFGSLVGSFLCFIKGSNYIYSSFQDYFVNRGKVIFTLVQAIDVYLLGTVMLVFGMGLYELFISNLDVANTLSEEKKHYRSSFFGLFMLQGKPKWLQIKTVNELKTKLGHVIVMLLLIGFFEKSKKAAIHTATDLFCFAASVLLCSGCLYLLSLLTECKN